MAVIKSVALMYGIGFNVVSAAPNGLADDIKSYGFGLPNRPGSLGLISFTTVPSTGLQTDITTCKPDLYAINEDGTVVLVATIDLVAVANQIIQLVPGMVYKLTFLNTALVTANAATVNIEARMS